MQYPKQVMKKAELKEMGFAEEYLMYVYRKNNKAIAWKMNPTKINSPILYDTEEFEKFRKAQANCNKRGRNSFV